MYYKPISLLVGSNNVYGIIFYQVYLLPWFTIPPPFFYCGIMVMLYLAAGSPQHLYQGMKNYVVIELMNIQRINLSDKIIPNSMCIIFWSIVDMVSIKKEITPNPTLNISGQLLVILISSSNINFGDTWQVLLIRSYFMFYYNRNEFFLKIWINKPLDTHEKVVGNLWAIYSMFATRFSSVIVVLAGDVVNSIFRISLMIFFIFLLKYLYDGLYFITTGLN